MKIITAVVNNPTFIEIQYNTLKKLDNYNVRVFDFVRDAIAEKLEREKHEILKPKKEYCPF
jgi:hypothetical protein